MRIFITILLCAALVLSGSSCNQARSVIKRKNEAVSQSAYAINDGFKTGRYDISFRYSANLVKLVPPPEKRISVQAVRIPIAKAVATTPQSKGTRFKNAVVDITGKYFSSPDTTLGEQVIILPPEAAHQKIIVEDSPEYQTLLTEVKGLREQILREKKTEAKVEVATDTILRDEAKVVGKAAEPKSHWWNGLKWGFRLFSLFGIVGVILLCICFPAAIPLVINVCGTILGMIRRAGNGLLGWIARKWKK